MYQNKKIGVFASHVFGNYQSHVCQGIVTRAEEYGFHVEVYASLLDGEGLGDYASGEFGILSIPNFSELDGIIFLSGTYLSGALRDDIYALLEKHPETPVVEITNSLGHYPQIFFENSTMTGDLTSHMIEVHGAKRLCFLGCALERQFSDVREQAFRDALTEHDIDLDEADIRLCSYDYETIKEALAHFTDTSLPDGIICYNDRMAFLLMEAAQELGFCIPDDFAVTGCDNLTDAAQVTPHLRA